MTAREKILPLLEEKGADCALFLDDVSIRWRRRFAASDGAAVGFGVAVGTTSRYASAVRSEIRKNARTLPRSTYAQLPFIRRTVTFVPCGTETDALDVSALA